MFSSNEKLIDKNKRDLMRKILKPVIAVSLFIVLAMLIIFKKNILLALGIRKNY